MPINDKQKIILIDINVNTQSVIETKLSQGNVIQKIVSLLPAYTKLLIVYTTPDTI